MENRKDTHAGSSVEFTRPIPSTCRGESLWQVWEKVQPPLAHTTYFYFIAGAVHHLVESPRRALDGKRLRFSPGQNTYGSRVP